MKKFLALFLAFCMIATSMVFVPLTVAAEDATITVNSVDSFNQAVKDVPDGGTINVEGTIAFEDNTAHVIYLGSNTGKSYTVTGGTLDFTAVNSNANPAFINIHDNITFENITLAFDSAKNDFLFACGYNFTVKESVTFTGAKVCFYGGRYLHHNTVNKDKSVNVTLLAGNYTGIYGASHASGYTVENDVRITVGGNVTATTLNGGGNTIGGNVYVTVCGSADIKTICGAGGGTIEGDVYVTVKDNANPNAAPSNDSHNGGGYYIYGGGSGTVKGNTHVYFMDNAKSGYVVGGTSSESGTVGGTANVYMMGGTTYSVYGAGTSVAADANISANIVMTGGTAWQIFGGAEATGGEKNTYINGDITIKLLGGTVKRRVYGGSYNEYQIFYWSSSHYVNGTITLIIGENINLALDNDSDNGCSAHSRRSGVASNEKGVVIYTSNTAKSTNSSKLNKGVSGGKTHETAHVFSYALNGNVITQTCSEHSSHSATATVTPDSKFYTGEEIGVSVKYSDNWEFEGFDIACENNVNAGNAKATLTIDDLISVSYNYVIKKAIKASAPDIKVVNNKIEGITTDMEYSTNGIDYIGITDTNMTFAPGRYYVRYAGSENISSSPAAIAFVYYGACAIANRVSARQGDTVEVIVSLNSSVESATITVDFDEDALTIVGDSTITVSNAKKGTVAKLTFKVNESAQNGYYDIRLNCNDADINLVNGGINVVDHVLGDVCVDDSGKSDGKITMADIIYFRNAIANEETDGLLGGADVNGDGEANSLDVIVLRQYIANYNYATGESCIVLGGAQ